MRFSKDPYVWPGKNYGWDFDGSINRVPHFLASATVTDDFGNRYPVRRCGHCRRWLERNEENFGIRERYETGGIKRWDNWCRRCRREAARRYYAEAPEQQQKMKRRAKHHREMEDAVRRARRRERNAAYQRRRRAEDPNREKEAQRRYQEKLKADPVRYARELENRRLAYHLRKERQGQMLKDGGPAAAGPEIPVGPLFDAVDRLARRLHLEDEDVARVCGVSSRTLNDWRNGKRRVTRSETVDRVLGYLKLNWWDLYTKPTNGHASGRPADVLRYIDEAQTYIAASLAFEGELLE